MTIYAIGDIHGHLDKLRGAHELVDADRAREGTPDAPLIHVGDLVDRGPDSAGVVGVPEGPHARRSRGHRAEGQPRFDVRGVPPEPSRPLVRDPLPASQYRRAR
jgi:hypothetical protein